MWHFHRIDPVQAITPLKFVAFVGAGGKTSFMEYLAERLVRAGKTVAITTTTKIYVREPYELLNNGRALLGHPASPFMRFGKSLEGGKLTGVSFPDIYRLGATYDIVLIEADGARGKPLKFPAPHEPVIPPQTERTYVIAGLDALYGRVEDMVFRWELLPRSVGIDRKTIITPEVYLAFFSPSALLKNIDTQNCSVVLNKYDTVDRKNDGSSMARCLTRSVHGIDVVVSSVKLRTFYRIVH